MKKHRRKLLFVSILFCMILLNTNIVHAYTSLSLADSGHENDYFKFWTSKSHGNSSGYKYVLEDSKGNRLSEITYCVAPSHLYSGGVTYSAREFTQVSYEDGTDFSVVDACRLSYIATDGNYKKNSYHRQVNQMAIWEYVHKPYEVEILDERGDREDITNTIKEAKKLKDYDSSKGGIVVGSTEGGADVDTHGTAKFNYDNGVYTSTTITIKTKAKTKVKLQNATENSYITVGGSASGKKAEFDENKDIRIVVPASEVNGNMKIQLKVESEGGEYTVYQPATFYKATGNTQLEDAHGNTNTYDQMLVSGNYYTGEAPSSSDTIDIDLKVGSLSVAKIDEYGNYRDGATFSITGPGGYSANITTANKQPYVIRNVPLGDYTVTETGVPSGLFNGETDLNGNGRSQTKNVTENSLNNPVTFVRKNPYQRGKVTLIKYDATNEIPLGDIRLAGAEFEFGAVNDIYEGDTLRYKAGKIETVVTDSDGKTKTFENLPIGKYYYTETKASEGCQRNTVTKYVEIRAQDQYTKDAVTYVDDDKTESANFERREIVYCPEEEIHVKLVITKQIDATDYDKEELLAGVQFKLTLDSDPSQVYYTHGSTKKADGSFEDLSGNDGLCIKEDIPYGLYTIHEEKYPDTVIPVEDFKGNFTKTTNAFHGKVYDKDEDSIYFVHNKPKTINVAVEKKLENEFVNKTDAKVSGAIFTIYRDEECKVPYVSEITGDVVTVGPTNDDGYAKSGEMRTRNYWMKETTFPKDMDEDIVDPNAQLYGNPEGTTYKDMVYAIKASTVTQTIRNVVNTSVIKNKPDTGKVVMVKYDDNQSGTDDTAAVNAKVRLTLKSNPNVYYDCTIDRYGMAEFENETVATLYYKDLNKKDVYSIPYGIYELSEIKESDDGLGLDWFFQKHEIQVVKAQGTTYSVIEGDMDVNFMLKISKYDDDTHERVYLAGGKYKVYDMQKNDWVRQYVHTGVSQEDSKPLEIYTANNKGELRLPESLPAGEYMVYEVEAPKGYALNEKYRVPKIPGTDEEDTSKLGKEEFGGIYVDARKKNLQITSSAEYPTNPVEELRYVLENLEYAVDAYDKPLKFQIKLYKTGDMFTNVKEETYTGDGLSEKITTPQFSKEGLNGVTFKITAVEDIWSEDGKHKYRDAGWSTTMTTGENGQADGYALSEPLYNGKYKVEEIVTPVGYKKCDVFEVDEHNYDQYNEVLQVSKEADNQFQPATIKFKKLFENQIDETYPIYITEGETLEEKTRNYYAVFGLYNKDEIKTVKNDITIEKDTLMYVVKAKSGEEAKLTANMPDGEYYFKELYVTSPYNVSEDKYLVTVNHNNATSTDDALEVTGPEMENYVKGQDFVLLKASTADILNYFGIVSINSEIDERNAAEKLEEYSDEMTLGIVNKTTTVEKIAENLREEGIRLLDSAEYELYADKELTKHIKVSYDGIEFNDVVLKSDEAYDENGRKYYTGIYKIPGLPEGEYYLKETKAPEYMDKNGKIHKYELYKEPIFVEISNQEYDNQSVKFKLISDDSVRYEINKTDIFTDKGIPNCLFTITDSEGNEKLRFVTDEDGKANIPTDIFVDGETYYFTELDAPKYPYYDGDVLYKLNTDPHEFTAHVDENGKWKFEGVDEEGNKETYEKIKIQNYRTRTEVELTKLDMVDSTPIPNCKFVLESEETGYRKEGVTDENGIYIFKDVPYGKYTYTELEAPEGWMIDTTPHEFTLDSHGTKIVVYDEKTPPTGDIAVIAIVCVAVISITGIAFVIIKNKKKISNN